MSPIDPNFLVIAITAIFGGGLLGAYVTYRKAGPEIESISVTTLRGVIEELRVELDRKDRQIASQNQQIGELRARIIRLEKNNERS